MLDSVRVLEADAADDADEAVARCINLSALTRPLSDVTVADRPGGADMGNDRAHSASLTR